MKHFFTALALAGTISLGASAGGYKTVEVCLTDETKVEVTLTDNLTAAFNDESLLIADETQNFVIARNNIQSFSFTDKDLSGVSDALVNGGRVDFSNLPVGAKVAVYTLDGKMLVNEVAGESYSLDFGTLPAGVVIVNVNGVSYKIAVKR